MRGKRVLWLRLISKQSLSIGDTGLEGIELGSESLMETGAGV